VSGIDVHSFALERLTWAFSGSAAHALLRSVLDEMTLPAIYTPADLRAVGLALRQRSDADVAWLGSLLVLHGIALTNSETSAASDVRAA
jgi:hypothetical protein